MRDDLIVFSTSGEVARDYADRLGARDGLTLKKWDWLGQFTEMGADVAIVIPHGETFPQHHMAEIMAYRDAGFEVSILFPPVNDVPVSVKRTLSTPMSVLVEEESHVG